LNEFEASSRFYLKDYGLSFLKEFVDIPSVKHRVYEVFFEELKEQRESFINKENSSWDVGNIKNLQKHIIPIFTNKQNKQLSKVMIRKDGKTIAFGEIKKRID